MNQPAPFLTETVVEDVRLCVDRTLADTGRLPIADQFADIAGACPACDRALAWRVDTTAPPTGPERARFLVPTQHMWNDVITPAAISSCSATTTASTPGSGTPATPTATGWTWPPSGTSPPTGTTDDSTETTNTENRPDALTYFADVGLRGAFWSLPDTSGTNEPQP
ncbi:MAG: hypothetical protein ACK5RL_06525 [Acidimicrobiales bacterium]